MPMEMGIGIGIGIGIGMGKMGEKKHWYFGGAT